MRKTLTEAGVERIKQMARRRRGVTIPEITDSLRVSRYASHRMVKRLVKAGILVMTEDRRQRPELFEWVGPGADIYTVKRRKKNE